VRGAPGVPLEFLQHSGRSVIKGARCVGVVCAGTAVESICAGRVHYRHPLGVQLLNSSGLIKPKFCRVMQLGRMTL
jgi:hypothetical protein